jgi:uncharacterized sulfatase
MPGLAFLPEYFRGQGYYTARIGKIEHNAWPNVVRWDLAENGISLTEEVTNQTRNMAGWKATDLPEEKLPEGYAARRALEMLKQSAGRTFFIGVGFRRPHRPLVAPKKYFDLYKLDEIALPDAALASDGVPPDRKREVIRAYYASISFLDAQVGRVLDALDRLGLADNTIVIFMSDHGYMLGERGQWMKQMLFERSARTPLMMAGPGVTAKGRASTRIVELLDLYPTLAELAGIAPPPGLHGRSLAPLLRDPNAQWNHPALTQVLRGPATERFKGYSVRNERWRYTEWEGGKRGTELYDEDGDPNELRNLAEDPKHGKVVAELRALLKATRGR